MPHDSASRISAGRNCDLMALDDRYSSFINHEVNTLPSKSSHARATATDMTSSHWYNMGDDYMKTMPSAMLAGITPVMIGRSMLDEYGLHYQRGLACEHDKDFAAAAIEYRKALDCDPTDTASWNRLGKALLELEEFTEAADAFRQAIRLNPTEAKAYYYLGCALEETGRWEEAAEAYACVQQLQPDDAAAHYRRAATLEKLDRIDEAIAEYDVSARLDPQDHWPYICVGNIHNRQGCYAEAIANYEQALAHSPQEAAIFFIILV